MKGTFEMSEKSGEGTFNWATCDRICRALRAQQAIGQKALFILRMGTFMKVTGKIIWKMAQALFTGPQEHSYTGQFVNNELSGQGACYWANGEKYDGHYVKNVRTGQGKYYWANKDKYFGSFENNLRSGHGSYYYSDGDAYEGEWKNDKKNGKGTFYWKGR